MRKSAEDLFLEYKDDYIKAYENANGHEIPGGIHFKNGYVIIGKNGTKCRAKYLPKYTETLIKRAEEKKLNNDELNTVFATKAKIKFVLDENAHSFYKDMHKIFLGEFKIGMYFKNENNFGNSYILQIDLPVSYKRQHNTKDELIKEVFDNVRYITNKIND